MMLLFHLGLLDHYPKDHTDFEDCLAARDRLGETLLEGLTIINQAVRGNYCIVHYMRIQHLRMIQNKLNCFNISHH